MADPLPCRTIRRTGTPLSTLSFGSSALGNLYTAITDEEATAVVDAAWDAGIRTFDVAPHYGRGVAERRLGAALSRRPRDEFVLSTKVGRLLLDDPSAGPDTEAGFVVDNHVRRVRDHSADGVRRSIEDSLDRLGLDRVDIVHVHDPDEAAGLEEQSVREAFPALCRMRDEGVVAAVGVGINQWQTAARFVRDADLDVVLLAGRYTLLEQRSLHGLMDTCLDRDVSVIAAAAFNSGLLASDTPPDDATFDYLPAPPEVLTRARAIAAVCREVGASLPAAALQFPLAHPAVVSVLVGMRTPAEVADDLASATTPVPGGLWPALRAAGLLADDVPTPR